MRPFSFYSRLEFAKITLSIMKERLDIGGLSYEEIGTRN